MNTRLTAYCAAVTCFFVYAPIVNADQKPPAVGALQAVSEKDVLGDWQTQGEGWRIQLNSNHSAAVYSEGYGEVGPVPATWKLVGNDVVISDAASQTALLKSYFKYNGGNLMVIPYKGDFVLLPREALSVAEKYGFVMAGCLWHIAQKRDRRKF